MAKNTKELLEEIEKLNKENKKLLQQLREAKEYIEAIKTGKIDALVIHGEKELKIYTLTDHIPQMAWTANADGTIDYYNSKWYEYTGMPFAKAGWETILLPDDWPKVDSKWKKSVKTGNILETECRIKSIQDDQYRWHLCRALPFKDETGKIVKWFGTFTDIEEQKKAIEQKDEFIGIASHELRTPITSLKGYNQLLELMLNKNNNREAKEYIIKSAELIEKLISLVTELHEVTKIQAGNFQLDKTEFNFGEFLDSSIQSIQISNRTHQISKTGEVNFTILADKQRLQQVLFNYLTNAIKYSPNSDKVIVEVNAAKNLLTVAVKDFGLGIPEKEISNIFTRFFRASSTKYIEGLGLGLYLCKQIIKAHNGEVWVESKEGKGSTFYFSLPILKN